MSPWKILSYTEVFFGITPNIDQIEVSFRQYSVLSFYSLLRSNNEKVSVEKIRTFYKVLYFGLGLVLWCLYPEWSCNDSLFPGEAFLISRQPKRKNEFTFNLYEVPAKYFF